MHRNIFLLLITFSLMSSAVAQEHTLELTLEETIEQARQQSPDAQNARHSFRSAYWNYKYYCANYLPTLKLTSNPYLDRAHQQSDPKRWQRQVHRAEPAEYRPNTESDTKTCRGPEEPFSLKRLRSASTFSAVTPIPGRLHPSTSDTASPCLATTA